MSICSNCLTGFQWAGTPTGHTTTLATNQTYVTGTNPHRAILYIHDLLGWTWPNARLLADHYAREIDATVYVPDFFGGAVIDFDPVNRGAWHEIDIKSFMAPSGRDKREPEIFACARALRERYDKVGAVGYCYGGWAVFRLGAKEHDPPIVDCVATGHPTFLTEMDVDEVSVPVQVLAPEFDSVFKEEMKRYVFETIRTKGVALEFRHFPGVEHGCFARGSPHVKGEREALVRGKNAVVGWMREWLVGVEKMDVEDGEGRGEERSA